MSATNPGNPVQAPTPVVDPKAPKSSEPLPNSGTNSAGQKGASENPIKAAAQEVMRKLKIDDQEVDEDEVIKVYRDRRGHQSAANKLLQEGKAAKKQAEEFISMMKDKGKLFDAIKRLGHDPRQLSEEFLAGQLEEEMMDPREKELKQTKAKLKEYEDMKRVEQEQAQKQREDSLKAKFSKDYSEQFVEALKSTNLPPTKAMVAEMAKYIHRAAGMKFQMTAQEAAQLVKEDLESAYKNLYGEADAETLVRLLGDQGLQKVRTYDTSRLKSPEDNLRTPPEQPDPSTRVRNTGKRMSPQEWRAFNRK